MGELIKVKRAGPRGWHLIAAEDFDPSLHQHYDEQAGQASQPATDDAQTVPAKTLPKKGKRK